MIHDFFELLGEGNKIKGRVILQDERLVNPAIGNIEIDGGPANVIDSMMIC